MDPSARTQRCTKRRQGGVPGRWADLRSASGDAVGELAKDVGEAKASPPATIAPERRLGQDGLEAPAGTRSSVARRGTNPERGRDGRSSSPERGKTAPDRGGSLNREGLRSGDTVALRTEPEPRDGDRMVARFGQEMTLKRFRRVSEECIKFEPESTNPEHETFRIDPTTEDFEIVSMVVPASRVDRLVAVRAEGRVLTDGY